MRHILGISGGKDSAALTVHLARQDNWRYFADMMSSSGLEDEAVRIEKSGKPPTIEYFFTDTGKELPEVYEFLRIMEGFLGIKISMLPKDLENDSTETFDHFLIAEHGGLLPSRRQRWCTYKMKLLPMERFVNGDKAVNYVGIRADEDNRARLSSKPNITAVYPFVIDKMVRDDIFKLLKNTVGIPKYYEWRSRSGCYFCFFQRKKEWLGLRERHPDLFRNAMEYEENTYDPETGRMFTWMDKMSLRELDKIAESLPSSDIIGSSAPSSRGWKEQIILENLEDDDPHDQACAICSL